MRVPIRMAAYLWAGPYTCIGIALGMVLGGNFHVVDGVIEIHGQRIAKWLSRLWVPAAAITIGHTVLGQSAQLLHRTRRHERVHVRQYERWGLFFVPAYVIASIALYATGKDGYRANPFEVEAFRTDDP